MGERPEFIQLEQGEDAPSVRDRLSFIHGKQVLLIWPESGTVLTRKLDLVLVQREAMRRAIRLALVTHDPQVIKHAEELNISTFETIGASERARWKRGRSKVFASRFRRPKDSPEADELMPVASRVRAEDTPESRTGRLLSRGALLLFVLGLVAVIAYVLVPSATVTLTPAQTAIKAEVTIIADRNATDLDIENGLIPATLLSVMVEDNSSIETSGLQDLAEIPAQGTVVFVNQTNGFVRVPAGTTVSTSSGTPVLFRVTEETSIPAGVGQQSEARIEALLSSAGEVGNLESGLINTIIGPLSEQATVRNLSETYGGLSRTVRAVHQNDVDRILAIARQQIQSRAYLEILPRLDASQILIEDTIHIAEEREDWTTLSAPVGTATDQITLTMRANVEALAFNEAFAQQIVLAQLSRQIPRGRELKPETIVYERGPFTHVDPITGQITFTMTGNGFVTEQIDSAQIQQGIAGLSPAEAALFIRTRAELFDGSEPEISITPSWFTQLPLLPMRIKVMITEQTP